MTIQATASSRGMRAIDVAREWLESGRNQSIAALVLYAAIAVGYFGLHVVLHLSRECACSPAADPTGYMWNLAWWPHAVLHGMNPFFTNLVFGPNPIALGGEGMLVPTAALIGAPFTLLFGPLVSYNLLVLASPALAALFAFWLCRYVTRSFAASLFGGYVFGFSAYMLGHMLGHLNLVLIFPMPAAVHLTLRLIDQRISQPRFIVLNALALAALLGASTELVFTFVAMGAVALAVGFALAPAARPRVLAALKPIVGAGVLAAVVTSPVIYYGLGNVAPLSPLDGDLYGGDGLGFLIPTNLIRLGRNYFMEVSARFTSGDGAEGGIYLGLPLALIVAQYAITRWRLTATRIMVALLAIICVLLLGSHLHIAGYQTIPLPWQLVDHSIVREVLPARLGVYMFLIVALVASLWLAQPLLGRRRWIRWAVVAVSIAFLVPNVGGGAWRSKPENPPFFTTQEYRSYLKRGETVLALPYAQVGYSMLWQAETGMWFRMAGGYLGSLIPDGYSTDPLMPALLGTAKPTPQTVRSFILRRHVDAVILGVGAPVQWLDALGSLGFKPVSVGGVLLYRL